jgi:hypothetical protein
MMRYLLLLLLLSLSLTSYAQEDEGWPITENCLGELPYPTIPQEDWDFEGVIFSYNGEGVRAIRIDVATSYYIAFANDENFPELGGFSPDGYWFAYPTGATTRFTSSLGDTQYSFTGLKLVSTEPSNLQTAYELPEDYQTFVPTRRRPNGGTSIIWLSNEQFAYWGDGQIVLNISTEEFSTDLPLSQALERAITNDESVWLDNHQGYIRGLVWFNADDEAIERIASGVARGLVLSPNGENLALFIDNQLHLAKLNNHSLENLCLELAYQPSEDSYPLILWSPDNNYLAFLYDGYPVLINLETREMQILRYQTGSLMGWYSLPED